MLSSTHSGEPLEYLIFVNTDTGEKFRLDFPSAAPSAPAEQMVITQEHLTKNCRCEDCEKVRAINARAIELIKEAKKREEGSS